MNQYVEQVIAAVRSMKSYPYKMGGWGGAKNEPPYGIDCRGFVQRAYRLSGAWELIGNSQPNVRAMIKWAKANGRFRGPEVTPGRGWPVFYCAAVPAPVLGNPESIRHVGLVLRAFSARWPKGRAISALNPELDVRVHGLNLKGLKIYGFCEPDWASLDADEPPIADPEPPVDSSVI